MFAALEGIVGVLYVAITIALWVRAYRWHQAQEENHEIENDTSRLHRDLHSFCRGIRLGKEPLTAGATLGHLKELSCSRPISGRKRDFGTTNEREVLTTSLPTPA
jgi:hypothetical protein